MRRTCSTYGHEMNKFRMLVGTFEGKRPQSRSGHGREYNIKINVGE
jgi:hypothetical protein